MECAEIRDSFVRGEAPASAAVQAHLLACPHCRELFAHDAELGRSLASEAALSPPVEDALFAQLAARVGRETGPRAWLRSRPSRLRFSIAVLSVVLSVIAGGALKVRPDFAAYPAGRLLALFTVYSLGILAAFGKELFLAARRRAFADNLGLVVGALGLPFALALSPATEPSRAFGPEGAFTCFCYGALLTLPTAALLWAFDRDDRLSLRTVCLSAAALGLSANLVLELHCPSGNPRHLLLGHASLGLAWLLAWALTRRFSGARA